VNFKEKDIIFEAIFKKIKIKQQLNQYVKSPLNYTGGKFKLLSKIIPLMPKNINTFVDLFSGGFNVGINIEAQKIIYNDIEYHVYDFFKNIYELHEEKILDDIFKIIQGFQLTKDNQEAYYKLRTTYNKDQTWDKFYMLICHAFNHQIRFNKQGKYNIPFGNRCFNPKLQEVFLNFLRHFKTKNILFCNKSFDELKVEKLNSEDYVYCDPPYLLATASYNEYLGWNSKKEKKLLNLLDRLNQSNIKFGLSNVIEHKGFCHEMLTNWAKKYKIYYINNNYNNCNYQNKNKNFTTVEVFITNM